MISNNEYILVILNLQKLSSHEPVARMHQCFASSILGARRFNFVQMKSVGSWLSPPQGLKLLHSNM